MTIAHSALDAIVAHARETQPGECCGLLIGTSERITRVWRARNIADRATRFLVDPADHFAAIRDARREGFDVIGAYHSHPSPPAAPSPRDLAESNDPEMLTVIAAPVGTNDVEIRAFYLDGRNFREVPLVPEP